MLEIILTITAGPLISLGTSLVLFLVLNQVFDKFGWALRPMGRSLYVVLYLLVIVSLATAVSLFFAILYEDVEMAAWVFAGIYAPAILLCVYSARRRAVDAFGGPGSAFISTIPIANLWLIFKGPVDRSRLRGRRWYATSGRLVAAVVACIIIGGGGGLVRVMMWEGQVPDKMAPDLSGYSPSEAARILALIEGRSMPPLVDEGMLAIRVEAADASLIYSFWLTPDRDVERAEFEKRQRDALAEALCGDQRYRALLERGMRAEFLYEVRPPNDEDFDTSIVVDRAACGSN